MKTITFVQDLPPHTHLYTAQFGGHVLDKHGNRSRTAESLNRSECLDMVKRLKARTGQFCMLDGQIFIEKPAD